MSLHLSDPWTSVGFAILGSLVLARLLVASAVKLLVLLSHQTPISWDPEESKQLRTPLALTLAASFFLIFWPWVRSSGPAMDDLHQDVRALLLVGAFWTISRSVLVLSHAAKSSPLASSRPQLVPLSDFLARILRIAVVVTGIITLLSELGYPIASLLAGVGVGGIAVALAAQKTVENLFGSISILADSPFRVGDRVQFDGVTGTVLNVGLRSTRLRTEDDRLVVMPNGKLAELRIENLSAFHRGTSTAPVPEKS